MNRDLIVGEDYFKRVKNEKYIDEHDFDRAGSNFDIGKLIPHNPLM